MGFGGAGDRALGRAAMRRAAALPAWLLLLLSGSNSVPDIAAVVSDGAAGVASSSPAAGIALGVATDAAATAGVKWYGRSRQQAKEDATAAVAGSLEVGGRGTSHIARIIPIGDKRGTLRIVRSIENPLTRCKEVVFSLEGGAGAVMRQS